MLIYCLKPVIVVKEKKKTPLTSAGNQTVEVKVAKSSNLTKKWYYPYTLEGGGDHPSKIRALILMLVQ